MARYFDLSTLGAVVVKSLSHQPWPGNEKAAAVLADAPAQVVAVEVNLSCPNVEDRRHMLAHSPSATADAVAATAGCNRPRWAKLSPNVTDVTEIAAALGSGAEAVTLINTVMGMAVDPETRRPVLGAGGGGLSGPAIHPVAVRAVHETRAPFPDAVIVGVGVGGVATAEDAVELLLAGANAVQVGTATFADPRAPERVRSGLEQWCRDHGVTRVVDLIGGAHAGGD